MKKKTLIILVSLLFIVVSRSRRLVDRQQDELLWRMKCALGVIVDPKCPIDGGWTPWGPWSACQGSCDQMGHRRRTRDCTNPPPSPSGIGCSGADEETESCHIINCTVDDFRQAVEGDVARTEAMRQLETVPALMDRCLLTDCQYEAIVSALSTDNTWELNPENVWNALLCVKHNVGCPVIGEWGAWGKWSACGARCGHGFKWRLRRCDTPAPSERQYMCSGSPLQMERCHGDQCAVERHNFGGNWGQWGKWSACSETCGDGVQRRRRTCLEIQTPRVSVTWGTHCRGQHDQLRKCENKQCSLDGGWSGWGNWGPCSQTCGAGKRSRSRSCTRPIPSGNGKPCAGPKTEVGSCYLAPCEVYKHNVALFNGDSFIKYRFRHGKSVTFIHFFIRFLPLSPQGMLIRRGEIDSTSYIRLSIQKWHICLDAAGMNDNCEIPGICSSNPIEPAIWHTAMVTLSTQYISLRLDDDPISMEYKIPCDPHLPYTNMDIKVGEKLYGEIQEVIFNFSPLDIEVDKGHDYYTVHNAANTPMAVANNVAYEIANLEEASVLVDREYFMRIPFSTDPNEWKLELTLMPIRDSGTILFFNSDDKWLHVSLQNSRLRVKLAIGDYRSESISASECLKDQWLDITLTKKADANSIETVINGGERIHVVVGADMDRKRRKSSENCTIPYQLFDTKPYCQGNQSTLTFCVHAYFVGGVPEQIKSNVSETFTSFYGYIASISLNSVLYDLHEVSLERYQDKVMQLSSRTASVSDFYIETTWGKSGQLNLSCLPSGGARSPDDIIWLILDTEMKNENGTDQYGNTKEIENQISSNDYVRVLRLVSTLDTNKKGFYTCRVMGNVINNVITYGTLGKARPKFSGPNGITALAVLTTLILIVCTFIWLIQQGIDDLRKGHGFFRDDQLTPEEATIAITNFIDDNRELLGSVSALELRNIIMRRLELNAMKENFAAQEPQGLMQQARLANDNVPAGVLPSLPENPCQQVRAPPNRFRFEPNYVSTPQHGSITSPRKKLTSSSSLELVSPRVLCSRIIDAKRRLSPRENIASYRKQVVCPSNTRKTRANQWKETATKIRAADKIIHMFQQLQKD
ncbi:uncharacterized protein LOC115439912 [Manduca sexta]|uniref:Ig-like domain-containing protein n=1 Tax=Manduca sexta TaxID=7130 RepID=A0A921YSZ3_MANSE|nr:uncharacterized protein LOC115439912 [Manduca sexta]KAG6444625.1 hypothetical protein O3G_MSEX003476 [Manduca sexta]